MGYRSQVYLKTTTEGYLVIKRFHDSFKRSSDAPLHAVSSIQKTPSGFYKIHFDDVKWYEGYTDVDNFMHALELLDEQDIPYSFIRIGEDIEDIVHKCNWTDDIPDEISNFEPVIDINDENYADYEEVEEDMTRISNIMFELFDKFKEHDDIKDELRCMNSGGSVSDKEYDFAILNWDKLLKVWEELKEKGMR